MLAETLAGVFERNLDFAYDGETYLAKEMSKIVAAIADDQFRAAVEAHCNETKQQTKRLDRVFSALKRSPAGEANQAVRSLVAESHRLSKHIDRSALLDTALAATATQVEHIEIALYGGLISLSAVLNLGDEVTSLLKETLAEEKAANQRFTAIAVTSLNPAAVGLHNSLHFYPIM